jgi:DNA (cytosine-5)-methyltransferase 1
VPLPMAAAVAAAIRDRRITENPRPCPCNCGRRLTGKQTSATPACRKRLQRVRENVGPTARIFSGRVTEGVADV